IRALFLDPGRIGALVRDTLGQTLMYAAAVAPDIIGSIDSVARSGSIDDVDRAMRWGFGWQLGPFEIWDAIGVRAVLDACKAPAPPLVQRVIDAGRDTFRDAPLPPAAPGLLLLQTSKSRAIVKRNDGASLVDLGDGVLCVEFHSKLNVLGGDAIAM